MRPSPSAEFASLLKSSGIRPSALDLQAKKKPQLGSTAWMRIDTEGNSMMLEVDKYAIMHRVGIHARDLRILDPFLSYPSTILGRERAIVLNLESIKAIVTADEVLLRNASNEDVVPFVEKLRRRLAPPGTDVGPTDAESEAESDQEERQLSGEDIPLRSMANQNIGLRSPSPLGMEESSNNEDEEEEQHPFEFIALEVALEIVCTFLDSCTTQLENDAYPALDALTSKVSSLNLERVRKLKQRLSRLSARVQKVREELEQLLDDDEDMAEMFLSRKLPAPLSPSSSNDGPPSVPPSPTIGSRISRGGSRGTFSVYDADDNDVEELEQLLEAYFSQVEGTSNKLNTLREYIDDTEDYINIQLDNHRNQLIQLELVLSTATMTVGIYSIVAGVFGMNIPYRWNEDPRAFKWVVILSTIVCAGIFIGLVFHARYKRIIS